MSTRRDTYTRADSLTTIQSPSDGGANYNIYSGTWGISTNQGQCQVNPSQHVCILPCGDADGTYTIKLAGIGSDSGTAWRGTDDSNHFVAVTAGGGTTVYRKQGGSFNSVYSDSTGWSAGDTFGVILSGSSHTLQKNSSTFGSFTDSFQSTATDNAGLRDNAGFGTKALFDDLTWDGAAAASTGPRRLAFMGVG